MGDPEASGESGKTVNLRAKFSRATGLFSQKIGVREIAHLARSRLRGA
jgi:hypothetical protein